MIKCVRIILGEMLCYKKKRKSWKRGDKEPNNNSVIILSEGKRENVG